MIRFGSSKTMERLNSMLTEAIDGTFMEENYDETELSRLESKWVQYLATSKMSMEQTKKERENIKAIVSDISHQTKTPISNILLYAELMKEQADDAQKSMAQQIYLQAAKLEFLIQSLVKMSRLETDILEVKPIKQKTAPLIKSVLDAIQEKARKKQIRIELHEDPEAEAVYDLKWTTEALYNVVDNAVKYTKESSVIQIMVKEYEFYVCISVQDEGIGIREEERAQIFSRFYRSQDVQQTEGVGIGLYLTREILKKEKGYVRVQSTCGKGSCFSLHLSRTE